ncbi:hypothetical protein A1O7_06275 [Cladophialophora yegresii CBS 114405]|uniref:HIT domain-containing protein n=1 Tax=Cladophialophora yegresii CBS 114405 TaxID=1182544 RepID=W9W1J7_9EURO|nr:uncharacterized protein A1O7_06275 [Cladophialophora yegresii CBS 114405]EXJ58845.1 hypothetical protein A1O7_06275 [Cladophialophora yegresii CBS 114405]
MSDLPRLVHESTPTSSSPSDRAFSPSCPFCAITGTYPSVSPILAPDEAASKLDPEKLDPPSFVLYSSEHVVAFLDIMPLTRGHVLVAPRKHRVKVGDLSPDEGAEIGRVLPVLARSVLKAVLPDIPHEEADYNVVQNNGPGAAQVVPHVHFHIVPRPPLNYKYPTPSPNTHPASKNKYPRNPQPSGRQATAILFGRGMREDLDYDDASILVDTMRAALKEEWQASFSQSTGTADTFTKDPSDPDAELSGNGGGNGRRGAWKV